MLQLGQITLLFERRQIVYIKPGIIRSHSKPSIISDPGAKTTPLPL
ncbi:MAG: hypothetical protein HZA08_03990 [Nitrospirae bacterium]|nr:hypothetical protein [Nitrospirota bacterium]